MSSSNTNKTGMLECTYGSASVWYFKDTDDDVDDPLPFFLEDVHEWYVRWDKLNVQHTPDSEWVRYKPYYGFEDEHDYCKYPDQLFSDGKMFICVGNTGFDLSV